MIKEMLLSGTQSLIFDRLLVLVIVQFLYKDMKTMENPNKENI